MRKKRYEIYKENKAKKKSKIDQVEDMKIWDSTRIYDSGRISGATDKGIAIKAHYLGTPLDPLDRPKHRYSWNMRWHRI
jgi:hypothetical protein